MHIISKETKLKISKSRVGKHSGMKGKKHSEESKIKIGLASKGRKKSKETIIKMCNSSLKRRIRDGYMLSPDAREKISLANKGKFKGTNSRSWKGGDVGYHTLHNWLRYTKGRPTKCNNCGLENKKKSDGRNYIEWANIDHKYKRRLEDYIPLCSKCHGEYDTLMRKNNLIK